MGVCREMMATLAISFPVTCNMLFYRFPWLTSLFFVGRIGKSELAAAALATTIGNVTGLSVVVGLNSALTTLASQAKGAAEARMGQRRDGNEDEDGPLVLTYLTRGLLVHFGFTVPIALAWMSGSVEQALLFIGQDPTLSKNCSEYLKLLGPGLLGHTVMFTLMPWCQAIGMSSAPAICAFIVAMVHIPLNILLIQGMDMGYRGAGVATSITQCLGPFLLYIYIFLTPRGATWTVRSMGGDLPRRFGLCSQFRSACNCSGVAQYLRLALPGLVTISEWWASETAIFLSGHLVPDPEVAISAMTLYQSINSSCFMFAVGFSVAASSRIGGFLGGGLPSQAKHSMKVCAFGAMCLSGLMGSILFFTDHETFPSIFTSDTKVRAATAATIPLLSLYVFADGLQVTLSGVIKGCGLQCIGAPIVVLSYWGLALPLGYYLAFKKGGGTNCEEGWCGVVALTAGMCAGTWLHFLLMLLLVCCVNWKKESEKAMIRVGGAGGKGEGEGGIKNVLFQRIEGGEGKGDEEDGIEMGRPNFDSRGEGGGGREEDFFFAGLTMKSPKSKGYGKLKSMDDEDYDDIEYRGEGQYDADVRDNLTFGIDEEEEEGVVDRLR
ncbi:hypothetical protein TrCOL_g1343 [Triparma columacea]|uniref:Multidrug and toxic compound extrusion protein n=1 Tax=Triparma columacea TaxID=722753 RepID=A0A9W7G6Q8_9STRA|nr:hypothetical protein TrCOL_g1343 [Triparma columacea]